MLEMFEEPNLACNRLVPTANEAGGQDNATAMVLYC